MWKLVESNPQSYTSGVLVEPNADRVALWIVNLGPAPVHITSSPAFQGQAVGIPIDVGGLFDVRVSAHGIAAQEAYFCNDPGPAQSFYILESVLYPEA
jgi:hypothetical protein